MSALVVPSALLQVAAATMPLALVAPGLYWPVLILAGGVAAAGLLLLHPTAWLVAWLLITGATVEMALLDLIGPVAFQATIAVEKGAGLALAATCALRWGVRADPLNPAWGFLAMGLTGLLFGLHPDLSPSDSLRSLLGSLAPFAFCFCRLPADRAAVLLATIRWCPVIAVAAGITLTLAGLRPLFVEGGGLRLAGVGHPAFLAGVTLVGLYACLIALFRRNRSADRWLLAVNLGILVLTGARAPIAYAIAVAGLALVFVRSPAVPTAHRLLPVMLAGCTLPVLVLLAGDLAEIRLVNLLATDAAHLSGRERLWPLFEAAADGAPWFGWGVGAGNVIIPPESPVARLLRTWAAHNEYLRLRVEGGWIGLGLLVALFVAWTVRHTAALPHADRWIMRLVFLALAAHAGTDNVLISSPACVLFTFAAAVFASARREGGQVS